MHLSSQARNAFSTGNYQLAAELYSRAITQQPELSHVYLISLNLSRKKLQLPPISVSEILGHASQIEKTLVFPTPSKEPRDRSQLELAFQRVSTSNNNLEITESSPEPLVSILVPAHNCANSIESSITSLLRQSWKNIEVIVVDLASDDLTWSVLQRLSRSVCNLKCYQTNTTQGLTFGINYALSRSSGEYIFFQNPSDFSHPDRIKICMLELKKTHASAVLATYLYLNQAEGTAFRATSSIDKILTLGLRRSVIDQIGYFSLIALADEEYLERLNIWSKHLNLAVMQIDLPLYYCSPPLDQSNRSYQIIQRTEHGAVSECREYYRKVHKNFGATGFKQIYRFPSPRDLAIPLSEVNNDFNGSFPIVANICSIPEREALLKQVLESISSQVDRINVYLDKYDAIPDFVRNCHPDVKIYLSSSHPGLRDNGKFLGFKENMDDCYYFTMDDDIIYPPDYVERMVQGIESYSRRVVVGLHGVLLPEQPNGYFTGFRKVHSFNRELESDCLVNNLGTGTVAFHSSLMRGLDISHFKEPGMADLYFSVFCKNRYIPMIALARPNEWLKDLQSPNTSLYHEFKSVDVAQSQLVQKHIPWGYASIRHTLYSMNIHNSDPELNNQLLQMIPPLWECLK